MKKRFEFRQTGSTPTPTPQRRIIATLVGVLTSIFLEAISFPPTIVLAADPLPLRVISDPNPNFSGIWVDTTNDEIVVSDDNGHSIIVYGRTASGAAAPLRQIQGTHTGIDFPVGVVVDVVNNEIWAAMNDTSERAVVFSRTANGNVSPLGSIDFKTVLGSSSNRSFGWSVDTTNDEVTGSFQNRRSVSVFDRATGSLIREIRGANTGLNSPHGNFVDTVNDETFVTNEGDIRDAPPVLPSITVYNRTDSGNVAPTRTVQGSLTGLSHPKHISVDTLNDEMAVANGSPADSITVYDRAATGDVAPLRTIQGALTGLSNPTGVFIDNVNNEIVVSNWGNHTITVYSRTADGDVSPLRTISTSLGGAQVGIGNPGAVSIDTVNDEFAVNNCVSHPRLAIFDRLADGQVAPKRVLEGPTTRITRSTHGVWIDTVNNEIAIPSGAENAILIFNRLDSGDTAPKRVIQGPNTGINSASRGVVIDTVNNEIVMPSGTDPDTGNQKVSVWDRLADGDVAPKREFNSADIAGGPGIWVDATNNEIYVTGRGDPDAGALPAILVFDRLATGTVSALRIISGTNTMLDRPSQIALDLVNNELWVANLGDRASDPPVQGSVGVFNRTDSGNVAPKRFIQGPNSMVGFPRAVWVDPVNNEIGEGDSKFNWIQVFPRLF